MSTRLSEYSRECVCAFNSGAYIWQCDSYSAITVSCCEEINISSIVVHKSDRRIATNVHRIP